MCRACPSLRPCQCGPMRNLRASDLPKWRPWSHEQGWIYGFLVFFFLMLVSFNSTWHGKITLLITTKRWCWKASNGLLYKYFLNITWNKPKELFSKPADTTSSPIILADLERAMSLDARGAFLRAKPVIQMPLESLDDPCVLKCHVLKCFLRSFNHRHTHAVGDDSVHVTHNDHR